MKLREGPFFSMADPAGVADHLRGRSVSSFICPPSALTVRNGDGGLFLCHANGSGREFPLRRAFVLKVFNWHNAHHRLLDVLSGGTLAALLTDLLHGIRSREVTVHLEGGEALTVTSPRYNLIRDEEVINACTRIGIDTVSRDDYRLRAVVKRSLSGTSRAPALEHLASIRKRLGGMIGEWKSVAALSGIGSASTVYDLFNVITAEAKSCDLALRVRLETLAGDLLLGKIQTAGASTMERDPREEEHIL